MWIQEDRICVCEKHMYEATLSGYFYCMNCDYTYREEAQIYLAYK